MACRFPRNMDDRGSTALEYAMVAPIWVAFVIGTLQAGTMAWIDNNMHAIVDAAARCVALNANNAAATKCYDATSMRTYAMGMSWPALWSATDFHLNDPNAGTCAGSQVSLTYHDTFLFVAPVTLTARACYPTLS